jgi:hypothetical protein
MKVPTVLTVCLKLPIKELQGDSRKDAFDLYNHIDLKELKEAYLAAIPQLGI